MERHSEKLAFDNDIMFKGHKSVLLAFSLCEAAKVIYSSSFLFANSWATAFMFKSSICVFWMLANMMSFKWLATVLTLSHVFNLRIALNDLSHVADVKGIV